jgi:DNA-binding transcriptional regulator YdaS (Cro superfamily)
MPNSNFMDDFCTRYGINKAWLAGKLGIDPSSLHQQINSQIAINRAAQIHKTLHITGKRLARFRFSDNSELDLELLREVYGVKKAWLAAQIGLTVTQLLMATKRQHGFSEQEKQRLALAVADVASAMQRFTLPSEMIRKAA